MMNTVRWTRGVVDGNNIGEVAYCVYDRQVSDRAGKPGHSAICLTKSGYPQWIAIRYLSSQKFASHRSKISNTIDNLQEKCTSQADIIKDLKNRLESLESSTNELCTKIPKTLSKEIIGKCNPDNTIKKTYCNGCESFGKKKHFCIHSSTCPGHCEECFKIDDAGRCSACGEEQTIECPVCTDKYQVAHMMKSANCDHYVCWECIGRSHHTSRPIKKCPCCRVKLQ